MTVSYQTRARLALAASSGLALALAFPKVDLNLMAWVAFIPLLYAVNDLPLKSVFGYAWLQGLVFHLASLYWVVITLHNFADASLAVAVGPLFLLAAILALDVAASFLVGEYVARRLRIPLFVTMPIAWTAFEWVRTYFPIGFPWNLLGYAAYRNLTLIQFSEFTGVYGVSALIMFFNTVVFGVFFAVRPRRKEIWGLSALTAMMIAAVAFGTVRVGEIDDRPAAGSLKVAMVQANIPQSIKWNPAALPKSFRIYSEQSELAARKRVDLIVSGRRRPRLSSFSPTIAIPPRWRMTPSIAAACSTSPGKPAIRSCSAPPRSSSTIGRSRPTTAPTWSPDRDRS